MFQILLPSHEAHILPTIRMLVSSLEREGVPCRRSLLGLKPARAVAKLLSSLRIRRFPGLIGKEPVFFHLYHPWSYAFYPYNLRHPLVTYSFDLWPYVWNDWQRVFEMNRPAIAFISAKASMTEMQRRVPGVDFRWLPEAGDPAGFDPSLPLASRPIDVLEVGRPFEAYHERIRQPLANAGYRHHVPSGVSGSTVPYREVVEAYSQAKVVVCFPRSITHPEQAAHVETTTFRYFECIFSKALMIGHCPEELIEILGYNPVIEANMERSGEQLVQEILPLIAGYQELVERNYQTLCSTWTVGHQAAKIRAALDEVASGAMNRTPLR